METKLCIFCKHFEYRQAVYWSTLTGSDPAHWNCDKGVFSFAEGSSKEEIIEIYRNADKCGMFEWDESIKR